jgi:signal peptidase II
MRANMFWIVITVLVVVIDQLTKYVVVKNIDLSEMIPVIDNFFYLTLHKNKGGAWGIFQNSSLLFIILVPLVSLFLLYYIIKNDNKFMRFALALILGGALGNYIDRLVEGQVTDFLLFFIGSYPFPIFNVADIAVTCGTILLAIYVLFIYKEPQKEPQTEKQDKKNEE